MYESKFLKIINSFLLNAEFFDDHLMAMPPSAAYCSCGTFGKYN